MGQVQGMLDRGQLATALQSLSEWYDDASIPAEEHVQLLDLLDRLAATVIYSREHLVEAAYTVQPGDTLFTIADRYQVPWQLLGKINGVADPARLTPGQSFKVLRGPFDASVNLRTNEVTLLLRGHYAGRFPCAIGQDAATPVGEYTVRDKQANPTYYGPTGIVDADAPNNPLGERQLLLGVDKLSIHGTSSPQGLGNETRGSIRLSNTDAEDVFDILSVGSRVVIRR
jgi:LysM repeat protein